MFRFLCILVLSLVVSSPAKAIMQYNFTGQSGNGTRPLVAMTCDALKVAYGIPLYVQCWVSGRGIVEQLLPGDPLVYESLNGSRYNAYIYAGVAPDKCEAPRYTGPDTTKAPGLQCTRVQCVTGDTAGNFEEPIRYYKTSTGAVLQSFYSPGQSEGCFDGCVAKPGSNSGNCPSRVHSGDVSFQFCSQTYLDTSRTCQHDTRDLPYKMPQPPFVPPVDPPPPPPPVKGPNCGISGYMPCPEPDAPSWGSPGGSGGASAGGGGTGSAAGSGPGAPGPATPGTDPTNPTTPPPPPPPVPPPLTQCGGPGQSPCYPTSGCGGAGQAVCTNGDGSGPGGSTLPAGGGTGVGINGSGAGGAPGPTCGGSGQPACASDGVCGGPNQPACGSGDGSGSPGAGGSCGGPNQPMCSVDGSGTPTGAGTTGDLAAVEQKLSEGMYAIDQGGKALSGMSGWFPTIPTATCSNPTVSGPFGGTFAFAICGYVDIFSTLVSAVMGVFALIGSVRNIQDALKA